MAKGSECDGAPETQPEDESEASAMFRQLRFAQSRHPREPLLEGEWG